MDLSNFNIDYFKTCDNDNIGMKSAYLYFKWVFLIFSIFINNHEWAIYANMITCIFDHELKAYVSALI